MRLMINCPSGESRLLQLPGDATVLELKQLLQEEEGIPVNQQVLCYAGQHLKDHLTLQEHNLEDYTLSDEVVLYLTQRLAAPKRIFLSAHSKPSQLVAELVEADMPVGKVMALLESRGLAGSFEPGTSIHAKRKDGSTLPMTVDPGQGLADFGARVGKMEGVEPTSLTFMQSQDGNMHIHVHPSRDASSDTYPVFQRNILPQPVVPKKETATLTPLPGLVQELCMLP